MAVRHYINANLEICSAKKITDLVACGKELTKEGLHAQISNILIEQRFDDPSVSIELIDSNTPRRKYRIRLSTFEGEAGSCHYSQCSNHGSNYL